MDIFAPGVDIYGACGGASRCKDLTDTAYTWASGTSMAVPHVAGMAAIFLEDNPQATPAEVEQALVEAATPGVINDGNMLPGTPNLLLYTMGVAPTVQKFDGAHGGIAGTPESEVKSFEGK